jgi:hypothetical protein
VSLAEIINKKYIYELRRSVNKSPILRPNLSQLSSVHILESYYLNKTLWEQLVAYFPLI